MNAESTVFDRRLRVLISKNAPVTQEIKFYILQAILPLLATLVPATQICSFRVGLVDPKTVDVMSKSVFELNLYIEAVLRPLL